MSVLGLDISTNTGWAIFVDGLPVSFGVVSKRLDWSVAEYPQNFVLIVEDIAQQILELIQRNPGITDIVIEEINKTSSRFGSRFAQKILDQIHLGVWLKLQGTTHKIHYINTSDWRKTLKLSVAETRKMAKEPIKEFAALKKRFEAAKGTDKKVLKNQLDAAKKDLKLRCIHGKIDKKSISVAYANAKWNLSLNKGNNDISDSLCQVQAWMQGCPVITNADIFDNTKRRKQ